MSSQSAMSVSSGARRRRFTVDALFTDHRPQAVGVMDLPTAKEIQLGRIEPDPRQPRRTFDEAKLAELASSIRIEGVLQPIVVRYDEDRDVYVIVQGERRWRASGLANCTTIPAIVREVPEERRLIQQLMENIVRDDLNAVDRAAALRALKTQLGDVAWEQVAEAVGIRRSRLFQLLGTEKLPDAVRDDIRAGRLSEKQSRALQGLAPGPQEALRALIVAENVGASEALWLARELRAAGVSSDAGEAARTLAALRTKVDRGAVAPSRAVATDLLSAIAGANSRTTLRQAADRNGVPPYSPAALNDQIGALAGTLARMPSVDTAPAGAGRPLLEALRRALDVLLGPSRDSGSLD